MKKILIVLAFSIATLAQGETKEWKEKFLAAKNKNTSMMYGSKLAKAGDHEVLIEALTSDNLIARENALMLFFIAYNKKLNHKQLPVTLRDLKLEQAKVAELYSGLFENLKKNNKMIIKMVSKLSQYCLREEMVAFCNEKLNGNEEDMLTAATFLPFFEKNRCELLDILVKALDHKDEFIRMKAIVGIGHLKCEKPKALEKLLQMYPEVSDESKGQIIRTYEKAAEGKFPSELLINTIADKDAHISYIAINLLHLRGEKGIEIEKKALFLLDSSDKFICDKAIDVLGELEVEQVDLLQKKMLDILKSNKMDQTKDSAKRTLKKLGAKVTDETLKELEKMQDESLEYTIKKIKKAKTKMKTKK